MQYIDIDSSYRNRNQFPLQASFDVISPQRELCCTDRSKIKDAVSANAIIYPDPGQNPQMAFYEETIQNPLGTIFPMQNLPFMYSTDTDNVVQLDSLVLRSLDPTTDIPQEDSTYPDGYVPLGQADEFYTGSYLEDVDNNEFRLITSFRYVVDDVYQTGIVLDYAVIGGIAFVYSGTATPTTDPLSNIDRYYVGKTITINSRSKTITGYTPGILENTIQLDSPLSSAPSYGDGIFISGQKWYATLQTPFTNSLPTYPAGRNPLPDTVIRFYSDTIYSTARKINYLSISTNEYIGIGVAFLETNGDTSTVGAYPLADLYYLQSADDLGYSWFQSIQVYEGVFNTHIGMSCQIHARVSGIVSNIYTPTILCGIQNTVVPPLFDVHQFCSTTRDGQAGWTTDSNNAFTTVVNPDAMDPTTPPDKTLAVHSVTRGPVPGFLPESSVYTVWVQYEAGLAVLYLGESDNPAANTVMDTGDYITIFKVFLLNDEATIYYAKDTGGLSQYYIVSNSTPPTDISYIGVSYNGPAITQALDLDCKVLSTFGGDQLIYCQAQLTGATVNNLYLGPDVLWDAFNSSELLGTRVIQYTVNGQFMTLVFGWRANTGLQVDFSTNFHDSAVVTWNGPIVIDSADVFACDLTTTNEGILIVVYSRYYRGEYELVSLHLNEQTIGLAVPYRIRGNEPLDASTSVGSLSGDKTHIILPSALVVNPQFDYIYLFSVQQSQHLYNDFYFITSYDKSTNTATISPPIEFDPNIYATAQQPSPQVYYLETNSLATLGTDSSGNGYNFTPEVNAQFVNEYKDADDFTVHNLLYINGTDNSGMVRTCTNDTFFQDVFYNITDPYSPFTISFWFLTTNSTTDQVIFDFFSTQFATVTFSCILINNGTSLEIRHDLGVPWFYYRVNGLVVNTWYHFVFTNGIGDTSASLYSNFFINGQVVSPTIFDDNQETPASADVFTTITIGHDSGDPTSRKYTGYLKNFIISNYQWSQTQALLSYNTTIGTGFYTLGYELWGAISEQYSGLISSIADSTLASQEYCYEVELTHLIMPNVVIKTGTGNRIAFYPYIYVEFSPINTAYLQPFASNHPNSSKFLFKVPIRDISTPDRAVFVNNFSGMRNIITFKPNDSWHFAIYLPDGELFETAETDTLPPLPPNQLLQVSATFGFKRLSR